MEIKAFGASRLGTGNNTSETALLVDESLHLYIACAGTGPEGTGAIAAQLVIDTMRSMWRPLGSGLPPVARDSTQASATPPRIRTTGLALRGAIRHACGVVYRSSLENPAHRGMAASVTAMTIVDDRAVVAHVGDTKLFLLRGEDFSQITADHLLFSPDDNTDGNNTRNERAVVNRSVGLNRDVEVDTYQFELLPGDRILLCTPGLRQITATPTPFLKALNTKDEPSVIPGRLLFIASSHAPRDEAISVVVVSTETDPERSDMEQQRKEEALLRIDSVRQVSLFAALELDEVLEIADRAVLLVPRENEVIFKQGDPGGAMYVIVEGECVVIRGRRVVAELPQGKHFGEMSLLSPAPRSATVKAKTRSKILRISSEDFQSIIRDRPATGVKLLLALGRELSERLAISNDKALAA